MSGHPEEAADPRLLLAAMGEAGMLIANAEDPQAARAEVEPAILALLEGLERRQEG